MNIIFPIGGIGKRFSDAGYAIPKPLIKIGGVRLIERAMACYPKDAKKWVITYEDIYKHFEFDTNLIPIKGPTSSPIETLMYMGVIRNLKNIFVADCDSFIDKYELMLAWTYFNRSNSNGGVTYRWTNDPACSFVDFNAANNEIIETREKDPFSPYSSTGPYWFRDGKKLYDVVNKGGTSVSELYNEIGGVVYPTFTFQHLGTPEAMKTYANDRGLDLQW